MILRKTFKRFDLVDLSFCDKYVLYRFNRNYEQPLKIAEKSLNFSGKITLSNKVFYRFSKSYAPNTLKHFCLFYNRNYKSFQCAVLFYLWMFGRLPVTVSKMINIKEISHCLYNDIDCDVDDAYMYLKYTYGIRNIIISKSIEKHIIYKKKNQLNLQSDHLKKKPLDYKPKIIIHNLSEIGSKRPQEYNIIKCKRIGEKGLFKHNYKSDLSITPISSKRLQLNILDDKQKRLPVIKNKKPVIVRDTEIKIKIQLKKVQIKLIFISRPMEIVKNKTIKIIHIHRPLVILPDPKNTDFLKTDQQRLNLKSEDREKYNRGELTFGEFSKKNVIIETEETFKIVKYFVNDQSGFMLWENKLLNLDKEFKEKGIKLEVNMSRASLILGTNIYNLLKTMNKEKYIILLITLNKINNERQMLLIMELLRYVRILR